MDSDKIIIGHVSSVSEIILITQWLISYNSNPASKAGKVLNPIPEHKVPVLLPS
jgi:hypothetical protein